MKLLIVLALYLAQHIVRSCGYVPLREHQPELEQYRSPYPRVPEESMVCDLLFYYEVHIPDPGAVSFHVL